MLMFSIMVVASAILAVVTADRRIYSDRPDPDSIQIVSKGAIPMAAVSPAEAKLIRATVLEMQDRSRYADMVKYFDDLEAKYGSLVFDPYLPSMYNYRGVALHQVQDFQGAEQAFLDGVTVFPNDTRTWINLGETRVHQFRLDLAVDAFRQAMMLGDGTAASRMLKAKVIFT
jgi:tetratricopeptide (TPR) repeat protein